MIKESNMEVTKYKVRKFKEVWVLLEQWFKSLKIIKHNFWIWYWISMVELQEKWVEKINKFFILEWKYLI
jgi:hypothetical protein